MLGFSVDSLPVYGIIHGNKRGDLSGGNGRGGFRYQETIHYYFISHEESVDGDGKGGYRYHTRHYTSHNLCGDEIRGRFRSQETRYYYFLNNEAMALGLAS